MRTGSALLLACLAAACTHDAPPAVSTETPTPAPVRVGGDRDAHGCIGSAGYTWCVSEGQCVRPWELAKERGFENSAPAFAQHCERAPAR